MDKKSKEALRRYKKARQQEQSSSDSSSTSDSESGSSSSYSSSSSEPKEPERHHKKKARQAAGVASVSRRSSSTSGNERRKRQKREHACQKKLEAKRNHLKRKLKEAKMKKRAVAAAAAAMGSHSHRNLSPTTQAKLRKLAERKQRAASKERREREREKHRAVKSEREHYARSSRSPTKITKIRIHQDVKPREKSPTHVHHQLMSREKIIIQTRTRDRTPSVERQRHEHKLRHHDHEALRDRERRDRERAEREAARDKERAEALARCQERQRERERIAREKLRREEEEKKYSSGLLSERERERLLPRPAERELAIATARGYNSRERSLEALERLPRRTSQREIDLYERERELLEAERRGLLDREELRREREFLAARRRELSPMSEHYVARLREERGFYVDEERERAYSRAYLEEARTTRDAWLDPRDLRERELRDIRDVRELRELEQLRKLYPDERAHVVRDRDITLSLRNDWKDEWPPVVLDRNRDKWDGGAGPSGGFIGGPRSSTTTMKLAPREQRASSEPDWDAEEAVQSGGRETGVGSRAPHEKHCTSRAEHVPSERRWQSSEWRDGVSDVLGSPTTRTDGLSSHHLHRESRLSRGFRRGGHQEHGERNPTGGSSYRHHVPPSLMTLSMPGSSYHSGQPRFPNKRNMTYTNPNLIKKQQAALAAAKAAAQASAIAAATTAVAAAKAAAHSAANATTNPGILSQVGGNHNQQNKQQDSNMAAHTEKPEAGEIVCDVDSPTTTSDAESAIRITDTSMNNVSTIVIDDDETKAKTNGELSEISDSEDDILDKDASKAAAPRTIAGINNANTANRSEYGSRACHEIIDIEKADKQDEEDLLDFEEISEGELEEDARNKGVGDALGVDWASLIVETKRQASCANSQESEQITTAKQKWQTHRILLDVGISMRMAGENYAKQLLQKAKGKLEEELGQHKTNNEIKAEASSQADDDSRIAGSNKEFPPVEREENTLTDISMTEDNDSGTAFDVDCIHPMACIQIAERLQAIEKRALIANACGAHSRALSARQDLKLRRQLCGLPTEECDLPTPLVSVASNVMKAKALAAFQRTLVVK